MNKLLNVGLTAVIAIVFVAIGAIFITEFVLLHRDFTDGADTLALYAPQQFVFFGIVGIAVLVCFFPLTRRVVLRSFERGWLSVLGVLGGTALVVAGGIFVAASLSGGNARTAWEIRADATAAPDADGTACNAGRLLQAHRSLRGYAAEHPNTSLFTDTGTHCRGIVAPVTPAGAPAVAATDVTPGKTVAYCAPLGRADVPIAECCVAQTRLSECAKRLWDAAPSNVGKFHPYALTAETIFLLGVFALGLQLASARDMRDDASLVVAKRLMLVGALLMVLWPMLNMIYVDSANAIYGQDSAYRRLTPVFNLGYAAWAISILSFFRNGNVATVALTTLGALNVESIYNLFIQFMGPGADVIATGAFLLLYLVLAYQLASILLTSEDKRRAEDVKA